MFDHLEQVEGRFIELESRLSDPALAGKDEFRKLSQEHASLIEIVEEFRVYRDLKAEIGDNRSLLGDSDPTISSMAKEELRVLEPALTACEERLKLLLLPQDPRDRKNVILEVRAGAGGEEAALFAYELFRAYQKYSEARGWRVEVLSSSPTGLGGLKEIIALVQGERVYSRLKYEAGVHRVQRVPSTEGSGRVHTSTVTVAVMAEAEEVEVKIDVSDLRIDVFRSGGAGGQGVNTTDSAVRITHLPSGLVVVCQDERSQLKNRDKAMRVLRARLLTAEQEKAAGAEASARREQVGTGDRSERIRTYNFSQTRVTDHRVNLTLHQLPEVMEGKLDPFLDALQAQDQAEKLSKALPP